MHLQSLLYGIVAVLRNFHFLYYNMIGSTSKAILLLEKYSTGTIDSTIFACPSIYSICSLCHNHIGTRGYVR